MSNIPKLSKEDVQVMTDKSITLQDYTPKPRIDGVQILNVRRFKDDGGSFMELVRLEGGMVLGPDGAVIRINALDGKTYPFEALQINHSYVEPGVIKAWHLHFNQEDIWFCPPHDRLLVGLHDIRRNSKSHGISMRFVLGEGQAQLLVIPRGVLHGLANPYSREMQLQYIVNQYFDADDADEQRVLWSDHVGEEFWQIQKG